MKLRDYLLNEYIQGSIYITGIGEDERLEELLDLDNIDWNYNRMRDGYEIKHLRNTHDLNKLAQEIAYRMKGSPLYTLIEIEVKGTKLTLDDFV